MQAELTNYWDQAYHSSRFCDYFLPEYWNNPFSKDGEDNKYLFNIPNVSAETVESDINAETVKLDETYIPLVEIYSEELEDGTTVDQFPVYTFKYDETPTEKDEVLSDQSKSIFTDIFFSEARIFKEPKQQNYIVINENKKLYKNYYIAKTKKNEENEEENTGKKWNDLVSFWLNDPEAKT